MCYYVAKHQINTILFLFCEYIDAYNHGLDRINSAAVIVPVLLILLLAVSTFCYIR